MTNGQSGSHPENNLLPLPRPNIETTRGQWPYRRASEVKSDLRFEISDLNYLLIHVHIVYMVWTHFGSLEVTTASKQPRRSSLTSYFQISDPNYLLIHVHIAYMVPYDGL